MSEQWRGLHNHDRHDDYTQEECYCNQCDEACFPPDPCLPCRCCLAAEVEALRAQAQRVRELRDEWQTAWISPGPPRLMTMGSAAAILALALDGGGA